MDDNTDHNQSGLPVKEEEDAKMSEIKEQFKEGNEKQESGPIEIDGQPEPASVAELISQVPRMVL